MVLISITDCLLSMLTKPAVNQSTKVPYFHSVTPLTRHDCYCLIKFNPILIPVTSGANLQRKR